MERLEKLSHPLLMVKIRGEDVESWLLGMRRYFQLYQYSPNLEARIEIYHLKGKASIWWDELTQVKRINENIITWR